MKYVLLGAFGLLSILSYGQNKKFTFKLGAEYELPRKSEDLSFFGNDKDGIINLSLKKDELCILRFNPKTLVQSSDKIIELPDATRNLNSETVADFGANNYWLHSDWDKSAGKEMVFYDKIDIATGKITETNKKILETTKIAGTQVASGFYSARTEDKYGFNYDADHKKLLISYRLWPESKKDKINYDKIGFHVFDENMNKLWSNEFTMPYTEAIMDNADFSIDENGNAYLLAKVYDSEKRKEVDKETGMPGYHYEVLKFTKESSKVSTSVITMDNYFLRVASLIESPSHEMIIACTYSKKAKNQGTDGVFLAVLDQSNKVVKFKNGYYEFPLEELTKFESKRSKRKMEKNEDYEAPNVRVREVNVGKDGSVFISCEEFYVKVNYNYNNGRTTTTYTYYYQDILASKIAPDGKFEWLRKIPKNQRSAPRNQSYGFLSGGPYRGTLGYKLISDASGYYFLFLDNKKNMEMEDDDVSKYHLDGAGGQVVVVKLDPDGKYSKELLFDTREEDVMIFPAEFKQINGNQFIGRAKVKRNVFQPLLITVN